MPTNVGMEARVQNTGALVARILMSAIFIWAGYGKLMAATAIQAYFAKLGVPLPEGAWLVSVAVELGGGSAFLLGVRPRLVGLGLAVWCIVTALVGHSDFTDPAAQMQFMKNLAMAGGFALATVFGGGAYSLEQVFEKPASKRETVW